MKTTNIKKRLIPKDVTKLWKSNTMNKTFWKKVLLGRTVKQVIFGPIGIKALVLDDGTHLEFSGSNTFGVEVDGLP